LAFHKAKWNKLNTSNNNSLGNKAKVQFSNHPSASHAIEKYPTGKISPCIPIQLLPKQVEEIRKRLDQRKNKKTLALKSYAQASWPVADILKLKDAFLALSNKKIIKIHNASLNKTHTVTNFIWPITP